MSDGYERSRAKEHVEMHAAAELSEEGDAVYNIGTAARKSGLSVTTIRTWEDRYGAVVPVRDASGRRLYSPDQITQLAWLRQQIDAGLRASEAHRLLIAGDMDDPGSTPVVDQGTAGMTLLGWVDGEGEWVDSVLGDLNRGIQAHSVSLSAVLDNPVCGPILTVAAVQTEDGDAERLALLVIDDIDGLADRLEGKDDFRGSGDHFGVEAASVVVMSIHLSGDLAGALVAVGPRTDDPAPLMQRAARVIESRIEADRARSAFSSLLD